MYAGLSEEEKFIVMLLNEKYIFEQFKCLHF